MGQKKYFKFYENSWNGIKERVEQLILENSFTLKNAVIGNNHGELYFNAASVNDTVQPLYQVRIAPTLTGKLTIEITFNGSAEKRKLEAKIKEEKFAQSFPPSKTPEGRHVIKYFFLDDTPSNDLKEIGEVLLKNTELWFGKIVSVLNQSK